MSRGAAAVTAAAVAVCAAAVAASSRSAGPLPASAAAHSHTVAVSSALFSCPGAGSRRHAATTVFAATPGPRRTGGSVTVAPLSSAVGGPLGKLTVRGRSMSVAVGSEPGPTNVTAIGSLAPGAVAAQWSPAHHVVTAAGIAASWCTPTAQNWWFAGAATSAGAVSRLVLTNPASSISVVDLAFFGPDGEVSAPGATGIALAPRSTRSIDLSRFAPALDELTVSAHCVQGQVAAALYSSRARGGRHGAEWAPADRPPAKDVLLNPTPAATSGNRLEITNPTSREALVQVRLVDAGGEFTPVGFTNLRLAARSVQQIQLGRAAGGRIAGVHLTSTRPVVAATVTAAGGRSADFAMSASSPAVVEPAVIPVIPRLRLSLWFVTTTRSGTPVTVAAFDDHGRQLSRDRVDVAGGAVTRWALRRTSPAAYVVVGGAAATARVQAVADYSAGGAVTALPVLSGSYTVARPGVTAVLTSP
jgi:hypothetical protein